MTKDVLESYLIQHLEAYPGQVINFSWHGGEPTMLGLDYFRSIIEIQRNRNQQNKRIVNGIQTNGTLLNDEWCHFFAEQGVYVGLSLDGPSEIHDLHRLRKGNQPTHHETIRGYNLLQRHGVNTEILCVVNADNVKFPLKIYRYFKDLNAHYITFLPLVERETGTKNGVTNISVPSEAWGEFLCTIFDEWIDRDIGKVSVQIFEEAIRTAFNQEHSLCIFRSTCGDVPVLEHNGDFYACDHYVDPAHLLGNLKENSLVDLLQHKRLREFGDAKLLNLPRCCIECEVRSMCNGECPKNRIYVTPEGEPGLNYLCKGYKRFFNHCKPFILELARLNQENQGK